MDLDLSFANGDLSGGGSDDVGRFLMAGRYDAGNGECYWTKTYPGSHDVYYRGFREGKGIWGTWHIGNYSHGGFHIWPRGVGEGQLADKAAAQAEPVDAIGSDPALQRAEKT
jgi:hypothetical protein